MANFSLLAKMGLDTKAFQTGLNNAQTKMGKFKKMASSLGPILGGIGLSKLATDAINLGSKISDMAVQLRISAEALQILEFAARKAGVETSIMERAIRNVQLRTQQAIEGNKQYAEAFENLGLSMEDFNKLPAEQKLEAIAVAYQKATDKNSAYNAVARILGEKAGPKMMEILGDLADEGFPELARAAKDAGEVMDDELIAKMDRAADRIESFKRKVTVASAFIIEKVMAFGTIFIESFGHIGDAMATLSIKMNEFLKFLGSSLMSTLDPAIQAFEAFALSIKAAGQAASGDFSGAKDSIDAAKKAAKNAGKELLNIPKEIKAAYDAADHAMKAANDIMEKDTKERNQKIADSFKELFGILDEESKNAGEKINENLKPDIPISEGEGGGEGGGDEPPAEDTRGDMARGLRGEDLRKAASAAGKEDGIRFERMGDGMFQQFVNGRKGGKFTEEQLQKGLESKIERDPSTKTLESIEKILQGKFVSE